MSQNLLRGVAILAVMVGSVNVSAYKTWMTGSPNDTTTTTTGGRVLMGGGSDVAAAFRWMISRSGGGDFVVIRAADSNGYNDWVYTTLGGVNSVETILFQSKTDAADSTVVRKIRNAEALFIAGGDQAVYVNYWKGTPVQDAINYLIKTKKVPVGGTSAGCALMTPIYTYGGDISSEALANPFRSNVQLGYNDFVGSPSFLSNTISDMHYSSRNRQGRHVAHMARAMKDLGLSSMKGIATDTIAAVCIDTAGKAIVYGTNKAFFLQSYCGAPETCISGSPLVWSKGVKVYTIQATSAGAGSFDLTNWTTASGGAWGYWTVNNGTLSMGTTAPGTCATEIDTAPQTRRVPAAKKPLSNKAVWILTHVSREHPAAARDVLGRSLVKPGSSQGVQIRR